ncbi:MAG: hypothetical protein JXA10_11300 [Anaerolineae bacterium]|nr:hypothetical protein [Anaerolineae bacterium]
MRPSTVFLLAVLCTALIIGCPALVQAQPETGAICVATFADANVDGQRDPDEGALAGVNVNLVTGNAIIATHITAEGETEYCFENLLPGLYTVVFTDSALYRPTTAQEGTFAVEGNRLTVNAFGAFPIPPENLRGEVAAQYAKTDEPLDAPTRLMLALGGSMLVMLFMIGIGAVILGILSGRNPKRQTPAPPNVSQRKTQDLARVTPPPTIKPPNH